jgi:hypothetical protein
MNKYIIEMLKIQSSVILPGLGSLMITNSKTGKVSFNPHLKFNDGALAKFIAEKEGTEEQEAQNQVAKFVREIEAELGKGNSYDMFEFGSFSKDKDGNVAFTMDAKGATLPDDKPAETKPAAKKAEPVKKEAAKKEEPKKEAPKKAEPVKETPKKEDKPAASKQDKNKFVPADDNNESPKKEDKPAVKAEEKKEIKKPEIKPVTKKDPPKEKNTLTPKEEPKKEEKKDDGGLAAIRAKYSKSTEKTEDKKTEVNKTEEKKEAKPTSAAAATAVSAKDKALAAADKAEADGDKSIASLRDKYKKSGASDKKAKDSKKEAKPAKTRGAKDPKQPKEKKKRRWPLIITLIILIGGGGTAAVIFWDDINALISHPAEEEVAEGNHGEESDEHADEDLEIIPDSLDVDYDPELHGPDAVTGDTDESTEEMTDESTEEVVEEVKEEVIEQPVVNNSSTGGNYHVIGGAFREKANAENFTSEMKGKGYGSAKILGQFDGLHMVSVQQFSDRSSAQSACGAVDGWVFKYPK